MDRINTPNAVPDGNGPGKRGFRDGNKAEGIAPTEFNALHCNLLQEEICNVIEGAGIPLDEEDNTQLFQALSNLLSPAVAVQGAFRNLKASANGISANVSVTIDELVTGDGTGNYLATRNWNGAITMTVAGAGGLDTGAVAVSTVYYTFGITRDDGTKALIASLSSTSPLLPAGYTKWARIGSIRTDATANKYPLAFRQAGRKVRYVTGVGTNVTKLPTMVSGVQGSSPSTSVSVATGNVIPPTATSIIFMAADTGSTGILLVSPNSTYSYAGSAGVSGNPAPFQTNMSGVGANAVAHGEIVLETTNIYVIFSTATSVLNCLGWEDNL